MKKVILVFLILFFAKSFSFPIWYREVSFYQIFPRSFYDSDGDGIGDLVGIIKKLDYISSLGVGGIWLNPTFPSPSYHGYDVVDYYSVNPQFGTIDDLKRLIKEAEKRNIKILLDLVINHTSSEIEWFKKSEVRDEFFSDWYIWVTKMPVIEGKVGWSKPWIRGNSPWEVWSFSRLRKEYYYSAFWSGMPDLNLRNPKVVNEIYKIARYWLEMGIGGFRLDAVRYLIETGPSEGQADTEETIMFLRNFNSFCKKVNPDSFNIGEVWTGNHIVYKYKNSLDGCFDFELREVLASTVGYGPKVGKFYEYFKRMKDITGSIENWKFFYPFSSNHDVTRVHNLIFRRPDNFERLKLFYTLLFFMPGNPFIYYGDEIGMINSPYLRGDMAYRDPMVWDDSSNVGFTKSNPWTYVNPDPVINLKYQKYNKDSVFNHFLKVSYIRNSKDVFVNGDMEIVSNSLPSRVVSFVRYNITNFALVVVYPYPSETNVVLYFDAKGSTKLVDLFSGKEIYFTNNEIHFYFSSYTNLVLFGSSK